MKKKITLFFIFIIFFNLFINVFATEISSPSAVVEYYMIKIQKKKEKWHL